MVPQQPEKVRDRAEPLMNLRPANKTFKGRREVAEEVEETGRLKMELVNTNKEFQEVEQTGLLVVEGVRDLTLPTQ